MQDILVIFGRPLGFWIFVLVVSGAADYKRWKMVKRRMAEDPFKGMRPSHSEISCPRPDRCGASYPEGYEPVSHRELMWKGVVCRNCGCEYDDYGRERKLEKPLGDGESTTPATSNALPPTPIRRDASPIGGRPSEHGDGVATPIRPEIPAPARPSRGWYPAIQK